MHQVRQNTSHSYICTGHFFFFFFLGPVMWLYVMKQTGTFSKCWTVKISQFSTHSLCGRKGGEKERRQIWKRTWSPFTKSPVHTVNWGRSEKATHNVYIDIYIFKYIRESRERERDHWGQFQGITEKVDQCSPLLPSADWLFDLPIKHSTQNMSIHILVLRSRL